MMETLTFRPPNGLALSPMFSNRLTILIAFVLGSTWLQTSRADEPLVFETTIQPLLAAKCGKCHSDKVRKGDLDLSKMSGLRRGGESGEAAIAETLDDSLLWIMVEDGDMPPEGEPQLTARELELMRKWIDGGAISRQAVPSKEELINQHDVLPIVLLRCTTCHGRQKKQGGLDLRSIATMRKGGVSGPAFVVGKPDESLMIQRIESEACPPRELLLKFFVRRPPKSETKVLRDWIHAGAPEVDIAPDVATTEPDRLVTDEERSHWAFRRPIAPSNGSSIDEFLLEKLKRRGLSFSPEADRDVLIRRAYFDLLGIPPTITQWSRWRSSKDTNWYRQMVDELLASNHYGERWGRYWLDLAGYADSEGGVSSDPIRKVAWKYRDYVVRSFNADKPYDRFLIEQIAGDELIDHENEPVVTGKMVENLIATGFLRMGIDQTGSRTMNFVPERLGVISNAIDILGSSVMGLTMECARCHSHKYDAIPQRDYYRFKATLQGALDEHDWLTFKNRSLDVAAPQHRKQVAQVNPPLLARTRKLDSQLKAAVDELRLATLRGHYPDQSESDRVATLVAIKKADNQRTLPQRNLVEKLISAELRPDADQPAFVLKARRDIAAIERELAAVNRKMAPPLAIRALWDRGEPSPTYIQRRGEYDKPGRLVGPGVPSVLTDGRTPFNISPPFPNGTAKTGRRLAFARWLTRPEHPLTARVMANRIWHHHFGTGLVKSLQNFGVKGERPSHPELLDWLAVQFVKSGWSVKRIHRLIMNSQAYRQSSQVSDGRLKIDPQNRLLSRMPLRRMDAEALRDSLLFVSGSLDTTPFGPPDSVSVDRDGLVSVDATSAGRWRRSIYAQYRRTELPSMMATFDYPEMGPNCVARSVSTVSPQSLLLMNNERVRQLASLFAARVETVFRTRQAMDVQAASSTKDSDELPLGARIDIVYELALSRSPDERERQLGIDALESLRAAWPQQPKAALETYCHTIFNSAAFLYID